MTRHTTRQSSRDLRLFLKRIVLGRMVKSALLWTAAPPPLRSRVHFPETRFLCLERLAVRWRIAIPPGAFADC